MALIKCHECGNEVSTESKTCPKCGAPVKLPVNETTRKIVIGLVVLVVLWAFGAIYSDDPAKEPGAKGEVAAEPASCKPDDLQCNGEKGSFAAGVYCDDEIEKLAKHTVKWTNAFLEPKFSHFRWRNQEKGEVTHVGDKVQFQNGFGAFTNMIYECDMAADHRTILDVRVREGRL